MKKFLLLGKYTTEAVKGITKERTKKVVNLIKANNGKVDAMYALLGPYDLAFIVEFPDIEQVIKTSVEITKLTGIGFTSLPAVEVEEFDQLFSK